MKGQQEFEVPVSMGKVAEFFMKRAPTFRGSPAAKSFVDGHADALITAELVQEFLKPFAEELIELYPSIRASVDHRLSKFSVGALAHIHRNRHMNDVREGENVLNDRTADALVVGFANHVSVPLDLAMYTTDLHPQGPLPA